MTSKPIFAIELNNVRPWEKLDGSPVCFKTFKNKIASTWFWFSPKIWYAADLPSCGSCMQQQGIQLKPHQRFQLPHRHDYYSPICGF
ncbi:hypothetical protein EVAR_69629_1 [Eumeta japonica]|uniref:Uncharacterized protein n=1 Tax=Eumeta variegata TaxID=151549 RepID=A0A4C1SWX7_EUMVA|nr:hypothetical protein EVAR_69629_1 [Eumeta japonica]